MDNNIFQMLSGLINKNPAQNFNNSNTNSQVPLYPIEAYSFDKSQSSQNMGQTSSDNGMGNINNMLPLLMSMMGQGNGGNQFEALSKMLGNGGGNQDISALASLFSSLNKNKKTEKKEEAEPPTIQEMQEGSLPQNDYID